MLVRIVTLTLIAATTSLAASAQHVTTAELGASGWRAPQDNGRPAALASRYGVTATEARTEEGGTPPANSGDASSATNANTTPPRQGNRAQVSKGSGTLPNDHGQVWREYDISPYTVRVQSTAPEQAIVDWILRETGYEAWHSTPVGLLSADNRTLRVYHTPQMQAIVADIVDRFVNNMAENHGFGMRIITIESPNWRARALPLMQPIPVQSPGVQGWILAKEDAALLLSELRRRTDYREHNPPHQMVQNGQSLVVSTMRPLTYTKGIVRTSQAWPGYQPEIGELDQGFSLEFSPLLTMDTQIVDAVVKLKLTQVEKMLPVKLDVPTSVAQNQRTECHVPQMTMVQLHERFRWPTSQVLLLSMGVVAQPGPEKPNLLTDALPLLKSPPRADALLFVESKGPVAATPAAAAQSPLTASRPDRTYHGRY